MHAHAHTNAIPVIFGEVLWDVFAPGREVPGGAPFNVARHLRGLGFEPCLITRVGEDARGRALRELIERFGLDPRGLQVDPVRPTGTAEVVSEAGHAHFTLPGATAYDAIDAAAATQAARGGALLYHGTLAAREPTSQAALHALVALGMPRFVDLNLRAPYWTPEAARALAAGAAWLKLNAEELDQLAPGGLAEGLARAAHALRVDWPVDEVIVTRSEAGAAWFADGAEADVPGAPVAEFVDPVGAGDAFSSVWIAGILSGWRPEDMLARATAFAAAVCGIRGAVPGDDRFYAPFLEAWRA